MVRKKLMAAGLSALMLLSGGVLVMGEETAASSVSETAVESAAETAAEDSEAAVEEAVSASTEVVSDAGAETAGSTADEQANSSNDYESNYYYETYTLLNKTCMRVLVSIKNTSENKNLYVSGASIDIEDQEGHLLRCVNNIDIVPQIVYPGNTGYFYSENINMDGIDDVSAINVVPDYVVRSTNSSLHEFPDSDISFKVGGDRKIEANGRITNDTDQDVSVLDVRIVYFDKDMNVLGIGETYINDIPVGATRSFGMDGLEYGDIEKIGSAVSYELFTSEIKPLS